MIDRYQWHRISRVRTGCCPTAPRGVAGVGQAAVLADRGKQQPSWWRWGDCNSDPRPGGFPARGTTTGWSFPIPWATPCTLQLPAAKFFPLLERAGLPRIRFHDLRHSAATLPLGLGIHPKIVSEMLGHSQVAITLNLYSYVMATMQQEAVQAFEGLLGSQVGSQEGATEH